MTSWQRRARFGVAAFGIVCATVVYFNLGERPHLEAPPPVERTDPAAVAEASGGRQVLTRLVYRDYEVTFSRSLSYADGSTKFFDVRLEKTNREGRTFVVTAREGMATRDQTEVQLIGDVLLREDDGLELRTEHATFHKDQGLLRAAGAVAFSKGRMHGAGTGMTYTERTEVLTIAADAAIDVEAARPPSAAVSVRAGAATLDRVQHLLVVDRDVRALHGDQVTRAAHALARLSPDDEVITFVELRGGAQVEHASGPLASMRAQEIDLDYTEDGDVLERSVLTGMAAIALRGEEGDTGREFGGETLDLTLAPDGSVTRVVGEGGVRMVLPVSGPEPARTITSRSLEAAGEAGDMLHDARFKTNVVFSEMAAGSEAPRVIHAQSLDLEMSMDVIANAVFSGNTTFEEQGLRAEAAEARYLPSKQTLRLIGTTEDGVPRISDERLTIDAVSIDVGLTDRHIVATGRVKTTLKPDTGRTGTGGKETNRVPGLLRGTEQVNVTAEALSYLASSGVAVYSKSARLWQADTEIRGETIELQQTRGDLIAEGDARSSIPFDSGQSEGRGGRIQYVDADRVITYLSGSKGPTSAASPARLTGPEGDVSGERIEVRLAPGENRVERVDATGGVSATVDARTATGDRLTYRTDNETYRVTGTAKKPMTLAESCNVWTGRTLTFSRSADTMVIDGQAQSRTENKRRSSCP